MYVTGEGEGSNNPKILRTSYKYGPLATSAEPKPQINSKPAGRNDVRRLFELLMWPKVIAVLAAAIAAAISGAAAALALWYLLPKHDRDEVQ